MAVQYTRVWPWMRQVVSVGWPQRGAQGRFKGDSYYVSCKGRDEAKYLYARANHIADS